MQLITFTNLYPSAGMPRHGIFVEERLRHLLAEEDIQAQVVALRPGPPWSRSNSETIERRIGVTVEYCPVPSVRGLSNWIDPWIWAAAAERAVTKAIGCAVGEVILDAHFLYPDGVAAVLLGERLGLPVVLSARGSDVNVKCDNPVMRRWVRWAAARSSALITVSKALSRRLGELGIHAPMLEVVPNGVDLEKFRPLEKQASRRRFGVDGKIIASVGHLVDEKGHQFAIEALRSLPNTTLLVVGEGPRKLHLQQLAARLGVSDRVCFVGLLPHGDMPHLYSAADVLVLPSAREGMPNVILESLACGTRVVATAVGGIGEVMRSAAAGVLISERSAEALVDGLTQLGARPDSVCSVREYATQFSWKNVVGKQRELYRRVLDNFAHRPVHQPELGQRSWPPRNSAE